MLKKWSMLMMVMVAVALSGCISAGFKAGACFDLGPAANAVDTAAKAVGAKESGTPDQTKPNERCVKLNVGTDVWATSGQSKATQ